MIQRPCTWPNDDLRDHLMQPLADGGHGFKTGIPVSSPTSFAAFHEDDHRPDAWWRNVLAHGYGHEVG